MVQKEPPLTRLRTHPMTHSHSETARLLGELIAIPSVNPAFLPAGDSRAGEKQVGAFIAELGRHAGLEAEFQTVFPDRANLLLRLAPKGRARQRVMLAPHLDTVGEPGMSAELFSPRTKSGRMHGRGACDTKGSVAAMLTALLQIARLPHRPAETEIVFAGLVDEENGQGGSRALAASGIQADLAIVGEPTETKVVTAHKGDLWLRLITKGKAAHGARPELGRNAVHAMARIVELLETDYAAQLARRKHPLLGRPTINVGMIRGGTQANIVPDRCEILIDRRTIPGEKEPATRREIMRFLKQHGCAATMVNNKTASCWPLETDIRLPLVQAFMSSAGQTRPLGVDYFCDAAILGAGGIPSVVFGPGNIAQAHTADEWIALSSLERATRLLFQFLRNLP